MARTQVLYKRFKPQPGKTRPRKNQHEAGFFLGHGPGLRDDKPYSLGWDGWGRRFDFGLDCSLITLGLDFRCFLFRFGSGFFLGFFSLGFGVGFSVFHLSFCRSNGYGRCCNNCRCCSRGLGKRTGSKETGNESGEQLGHKKIP